MPTFRTHRTFYSYSAITLIFLFMCPPGFAEPADPLSNYSDSNSDSISIVAPSQLQPKTPIATPLPVDINTPTKLQTEDPVEAPAALAKAEVIHPDVDKICKKIGNKLSSVSVDECLKANFNTPRFYSSNNSPLLEKHFPAASDVTNPPRILFIGGIHGDEYSSISVSFKWLKSLDKHHSGIFDWHFLPLTNPDGLLRKKSTRVNASNVDLNRNFIPAETSIDPIKHWKTYAKKRARYYPGTSPLSEPESRAIHHLIDEQQPDVIVSVHAPHGILDFDGTVKPPKKLGPLHLKQLGTYPGSLGNYGWFVKQIPVMTIELKHAGIMPKQKDIDRMWIDLVHWIKLRTDGDGTLLARKTTHKTIDAAKVSL